SDLWERITFPEKSHLRGKELRLTWDSRDLWRLVVKRALASPGFSKWAARCVPPPVLDMDHAEIAGEETLHPYLDLLFERQIWAGKNALSRSWISRRLS